MSKTFPWLATLAIFAVQGARLPADDAKSCREDGEHEQPERRVRGVELRDGRTLAADAVVITTGTFLNGLAHVGEQTFPLTLMEANLTPGGA